MRSFWSFSIFSILGSVLVCACSSTETGSGGSSGSSGSSSGESASGAQVDACKRACDKMKFFQCNSAEEQARCYADCDKATPSQIELFNACAQNSICDPSCRTNIQPSGSKGTGATANSCASACDKLVTCSLIPIGAKSSCVDKCEKEGYQYQVDCAVNSACDKIESACGGGTGGESGGGGSTGTSSGGD